MQARGNGDLGEKKAVAKLIIFMMVRKNNCCEITSRDLDRETGVSVGLIFSSKLN